LSKQEASKFLKNNTNSGLPYLGRKSQFKSRVIRDFEHLLERNDPCMLFTRTQELGKTRTVWGYPMVETLNEMCYYRPLLEYQKKLNWRSALLGPKAVDESITNLIQLSISRGFSLVSCDFSSYDASVKIQLQKAAFQYIKEMFQVSYHDEIDDIFIKFNTIGLITPSGILSGPHGVPSGSTFTNEVDSIVQYLCSKQYGLEDQSMNIQGDDGAYSVADPYTFFDHFKQFNLNIEESKSFVDSRDIIYLQNLHSPDYVNSEGLFAGIYPTYRALGRIIFPERYTKYNVDGMEGADFNSIRAISILENCSQHPLFEDLVKYIYQLDKYKLHFTRKGLKSYVRHLALDQVPGETFMYKRGDYIHGLESFETVKILSKL
jgi:hypothetical protein